LPLDPLQALSGFDGPLRFFFANRRVATSRPPTSLNAKQTGQTTLSESLPPET
jgi:hypothetical protein